ncbi:hypothetical protein GCM10009412_17030 [Aeromonas salmonicida subsp. achromogenes]
MGKVGLVQCDARIQGIAIEKNYLLHDASCHWSRHDAKYGRQGASPNAVSGESMALSVTLAAFWGQVEVRASRGG